MQVFKTSVCDPSVLFSSPDPKSKKQIPVNQLIKKFWPSFAFTNVCPVLILYIHRSLKSGTHITYIASKPKAQEVTT